MSLSQTAPRPLVLADLWVGGRVRGAVLVLTGALATGLAAQVAIPLPGTPVPLTLQTLAVLVTGTALGSRLGALSMAVYAGLGFAGVPWFALGALSMAVYAGLGFAGVPWFAGQSSGFAFASLGYVVGFVVAAWVCGALAERSADRRVPTAALSMVLGNLVIYGCGVAGLMAALDVSLPTAISVGVVPFLVGDLLKIVVAGGLLPSVWKATGRS
jgi:biotin transport system substrate-specific component